MPPEVIVASRPELAEAFARLVEGQAETARAEGRSLTIAVPGGSVAEAFFPRLVRIAVDWRRVQVFFADERAVRPDDPASNFRAAREAWLDRVPIPLANVHRMRGEADDLGAAAAEYERGLLGAAGRPPRLDIVLLGVGEDGHVASLFPGHVALAETERYVVAVREAPKPPPDRLTLTLVGIAAARTVVVAAFGAAKAKPVAAVLGDPRSELPAALALRAAPRALVYLDPAAASRDGA